MGMIDALRNLFAPDSIRSVTMPWLPDDWPFVSMGGHIYPLGQSETIRGTEEKLDYTGKGASRTFGSNAIVFACMAKRMKLFSEARIRYQRMQGGKPGDLWGDASLDILEHPWPNAATGDLLARAIQDADIYGNFYATRRKGAIRRLKPDWVTIVLGSSDPRVQLDARDIDADVIGYVYHPGGEGAGREPEYLLREQVMHFAPYPDPLARFRGMSWLTPVVREVAGDDATTDHKLQFFRQGATPNMIVKRGVPAANETFKEWVRQMREASEGVRNAYRTFYMSQGADATVVGKDFQQIEFRATQGAGEVRIIAASGLHPVIVGVSESLQGSSLNSGNFGAARRLTADTFLRPDWRNFVSSLETIVRPPSGSRLWYDDKDIPFLREDSKDAAMIQQVIGATIGQYVRDGFTPDSAKAAALAENPSLLKHSGLFSVQLQAPGVIAPVEVSKPTNGAKPPVPTGGSNP